MNTVWFGDCRTSLRQMPAVSVDTVMTSPSYFGLRDYNHVGQIGIEGTLENYVTELVEFFHEVYRVLREDGTLWLNLGDSYSHGGCGSRNSKRWPKQSRNDHMPTHAKTRTGLRPKELMGVPWRVAFALQSAGWLLRQEIIWSKPNPMPESVKDRCTKSHETIFLFSKSPKYYFDIEAIAEPAIYSPGNTTEIERAKGYYAGKWSEPSLGLRNDGAFKAIRAMRRKRSVWSVPP